MADEVDRVKMEVEQEKAELQVSRNRLSECENFNLQTDRKTTTLSDH